MSVCSSCGAENSVDSKFCQACGTSLVDQAATESQAAAPQETESFSHRGPPSSNVSSAHGRFEPGHRLGTRYRIVGLLGRGGMGEVYRADDLELGQSVALKFLPPEVANDEAALQRFRNEVRTARQISHPNICRIYDIGQEDGHVFLSMEYIDGEDLAQVLQRMGRPSREKALEIARQLCLGLAAAHEVGVLHRDLKPGNIMIDGRGRVRITDFGLAAWIDEIEGRRELAGTPAYMAPEQLASGTVSVRSDLYALGLVLYEVFTGGRVYETNDLTELRALHSSSTISTTSTIAEEVDPVVERVILRCLEKDPQQRPASVYSVLGALPGADPLTAALAAGETPSPELVAAAGDRGYLSPKWCLTCLVIGLALLVINVGLAPLSRLDRYVPLEKSDDDLGFSARTILEKFGYQDLPEYRASGFEADRAVLENIENRDPSANRWDQLAEVTPSPVVFWYRASPKPMVGYGLHVDFVHRDNPPLSEPGSVRVVLDPEGKLVEFAAVPRAREASEGVQTEATAEEQEATAEEQDQELLTTAFEALGVSRDEYEETAPVKPPEVYCDRLWAFRQRAAEESSVDGPNAESNLTTTIQIGSFAGTLNYIGVEVPGIGKAEDPRPAGAEFVIVLLIFGVVIFAAIFNIRLGRGDRRGAFRLALFVIISMMISWTIPGIPLSRSVLDVFEALVVDKPLGHALQHAFVAWILYMALEPFARRYCPITLVTWTRLLMGRFRDPQLGRDILLGGVLVGLLQLVYVVRDATIKAMGAGPAIPETLFLDGALRLDFILNRLVISLHTAVVNPMGILAIFVIARATLRNQLAAILAVLVVMVGVPALSQVTDGSIDLAVVTVNTATNLFWAGCSLFVLLRFGLLATATAAYIGMNLVGSGVSWDLSSWYAGPNLAVFFACAGLLVFGFYIALAGRPVFREEAT